ncbi:MAG: hypothetical protein V4640_08385 [Verrucomicrobiota bacterium]
MFAFDEGFQGGEMTIEAEIAAQTKEINGMQAAVIEKTAILQQSPARIEAAKELRLVKVEGKTLEQNAARLKADIESETVAITELEKTWAAYKDEYRAFVRGKATGENLDLLEVRDGTVYKEVNIREVTAIGIQIRHANGFKRLPFEELTDAMQDYYQYDVVQRDEALAAEQAARLVHESAAGVAMDQEAQKLAKQRAEEETDRKEKVQRDIVRKQAQITDAQADIRELEQEIVRADAAAAAARAAGRMHLSKSNNIRGKIRSKKEFISTLKADIQRLQSQI